MEGQELLKIVIDNRYVVWRLMGLIIPYNSSQVMLRELKYIGEISAKLGWEKVEIFEQPRELEKIFEYEDGLSQYFVFQTPFVGYDYDTFNVLKLVVEHYNPEKQDFEIDEAYLIYNQGFAKRYLVSNHWHLPIELSYLHVEVNWAYRDEKTYEISFEEMFKHTFTPVFIKSTLVKLLSKIV